MRRARKLSTLLDWRCAQEEYWFTSGSNFDEGPGLDFGVADVVDEGDIARADEFTKAAFGDVGAATTEAVITVQTPCALLACTKHWLNFVSDLGDSRCLEGFQDVTKTLQKFD